MPDYTPPSAAEVDTDSVTTSGALMDSEITNLAQVKAFDESDYATAAQGAKADSAQQPPTEGAFANGDKTKLDGIAAGATAYTNAAAIAAVEGEATLALTGDVYVAQELGVGTTSPDFPLHVVDDTTISSYTDLANAAATIESTSDGVVYGPVLKLYRNSPSAEDGNYVGMIRFTGNADNQFGAGQVEHTYAQIYTQINDVSGGTEDATLNLQAIFAGGETGRLTIATDITINSNLVDSNFIVNGSGGGAPNLIRADAGLASVGIRTAAPVATLDIGSGYTFRNTRLLTVSVSDGTTLTEAAHAGRYNICAGGVTLPSTSTAGEHYAILNTTGGNITIGRNSRNINGAASDFTLATYKAATCIAIGSNNWMIVG